jgi:nicotinate phosphoribosyltransferase
MDINKKIMIIKSLLDVDFYKATMCQIGIHRYPKCSVEYKFYCRTEGVDLLPYLNEIKNEIMTLSNLRLSKEESQYLSSIRFLHPNLVRFLKDLKLDPENEVIIFNDGKNLGIKIMGNWIQTIWYETMILAIVNEIYFRDKMLKDEAIKSAIKRLGPKIEFLEINPGIKISEFGTRRRHSFEVQDLVVEGLKKLSNFMGTSNIYLSMKHGVKPIGTQAHEYFCLNQSMVRVNESQKFALLNWSQEFDGDLGIALTDTINMDVFLKDFGRFYAKLFDGCRHDSGDPVIWGEKLIKHYRTLGIDPMTKTAVFSDGLNLTKCKALYDHFKDKINVVFGVGTDLTNDVGMPALNIVIKMTKCNGQSVAKISDNAGKNICDDPIYMAYLKKSFEV